MSVAAAAAERAPEAAQAVPARRISEALAKRDGLSRAFPKAAAEEARRLARTVAVRPGAGRTDLRGVPFCTMDGADAKDFDDAVAAQRLKGGAFKLRVAVADVAEYVRRGSALDREAQLRCESAYLPGLTVPMLPEALSNGACSLRPGEDRLAVVCSMRVSAGGEVEAHGFQEAVIRSRRRLTYEEADALLGGAAGSAGDAGLDASLEALAAVHEALLGERRRRGALAFAPCGTEVLVDADGAMSGMAPEAPLKAHSVIEEAMIAANRCAAEFLREHRIPAPHRSHPAPGEEDLERACAMLGALAPKAGGGPGGPAALADPAAYLSARRDAARSAGAAGWLCDLAVKRGMPRAGYGEDAEAGHFALAVPLYAHFTSPIRRTADLLVHRGMKAVLRGGRPGRLPAGLCERLNERGALIDRAARDAERVALCGWFAVHAPWRSERLACTVSGVADFGAFVAFDGWGVEGLAHVRDLGGGAWSERGVKRPHEIFAEGSGRRVIGLGDRVRARVAQVDPLAGRIVVRGVEGRRSRPRRRARP